MGGQKTLSEDDISVKFITPALHKAGWDEDMQIRRQVGFTKGRIIVRGKPKPAGFILYDQHIQIDLIGLRAAPETSLALDPFLSESREHRGAAHIATFDTSGLLRNLDWMRWNQLIPHGPEPKTSHQAELI